MIVLRDSGQRRGYVRYTAEEWGTFIRGVKAGEFDDLGVLPTEARDSDTG